MRVRGRARSGGSGGIPFQKRIVLLPELWKTLLQAMSEFKFACPVCGQHITADSHSSGGHLECPTCFQKIIVPQAPASADPKFIVSAAQVAKPRPTGMATDSG